MIHDYVRVIHFLLLLLLLLVFLLLLLIIIIGIIYTEVKY